MPTTFYALVFAAVSMLVGAPVCLAAERAVTIKYEASVDNIPANTKQVDVWLPLPMSSESQLVESQQIDPKAAEITSDEKGNKFVHLRIAGGKVSASASIDCKVTRREQAAVPANADRLSESLRPDVLVPINESTKKQANQIVSDAHAKTNMEKARAIYDYVVSNMKYEKTGHGWGRGDLEYACSAKKGNCSDFHAVFIGFCRAVNIPARFTVGFPLPADKFGTISGYHCWAEFYEPGKGWIPVDASEACKHPDKRNYFFGHLDQDRIAFTRGRDLVLAPPQGGHPLNFFIYPYAEADGKEIAATWKLTFANSDQGHADKVSAASK